MFGLGVLLDGQGKAGEAEEWYRKAATAEHAGAMFNLGALLHGQGKDGEAEEWWRKAAAAEHAARCLAWGSCSTVRGRLVRPRSGTARPPPPGMRARCST